MLAEEKQPLLSPIMRWFLFAMVLANIGGQMSPMLMPIYLTELGASVGQVGIVFTISSIAILFLQIFGGWLSDSIGRLRAIAIGSIGGIIGYIAILLAPTWQWMIVALSVSMIPYALVGPSFGAFIAENSTEENRGRVYGITETIFQITGVVGPPLGGILAMMFNFKLMLFVAAVLYTSAAGLRIWMATTMSPPQEEDPQELTSASFKSSLRTMAGMILGGGVITWIFITDGVRDFAFRLSFELQPLYLEQVAGISLLQIGILGSIFSISMMLIPMISGTVADKYGERVPITAGFLLVCIALVVFLNVYTFMGFAIVWVIFGLGVGMLAPAYQSLISKVVPQKMLGIFTGLFRSSIGFISLPAPYIGAQLWERFGPRVPFRITAVAAFLTIIPIWLTFKVPEKEEEPAPITTD
ncbi:MAG: MFS transporter [Anaerolineales bacterium]|nr:MAG: MFS transporter [Anaerolineales bacterium]